MSDSDDRIPVKLPFYAKLALVLISLVLVVFLLQAAKQIIIPLFFSGLIAMLLLPFTKWLERHKIPKPLAALISILLFITCVSAVVYFLVFQIIEFSHHADEFRDNILKLIAELQEWVRAKYHIGASEQVAYLSKLADGAMNTITSGAQLVVVSLIGIIIWTIFVFIFTFFMLTHRALLRRFILSLFRHRDQERVTGVIAATQGLANSYVMGLMIEMVVVAILNCTVLSLFGVKYAILLGALGAVLNIIPYLGIYTSASLAALVTLANGSPQLAVTVVAIFLVVHFLDANILLPRIVGGQVKMNPLITIVAVLLGNLVWGIPGMFLFIPLFAILKLIFEKVDGMKPWAILVGTKD